jgi:hypothetical protein
LFPPVTAIFVAGPVTAYAVKVTEVLVPLIVALTVSVPGTVPRVNVLLATPLELVVEDAAEREPPPLRTFQLI